MVELSTGTPSITNRGSFDAESEAPERILTVAPEPGAPPLLTTFTPGIFPTMASCTEVRFPLLKSSGRIAATDPVASSFFTVP